MHEEKILLVDDNPNNIELLFDLLKDKYEIHFATHGLKAIELAKEKIPDLILLDIMMPEIEGYEICSRLKANNMTKDIPVIFLTAKLDVKNIVQGFSVGAADYITKPFNSAELFARVNTQLALRKAHYQHKELLHILSHDLVNLFSAVKAATELIGEEPIEEMKKILFQATSQGLEIIDMVRKMQALNDKPIDLYEVNLAEAIDSSYSLLKNKFQNKNITLEIDVDKSIHIIAEPISLINSVFNNIFTNAIKFSYPNSSISIQSKSDNATVSIQITDEGIGIPNDLLPHLFMVNKSTSRPGTEGEKGTGFGMPLIKKFILSYGGEIHVFSKTAQEDPEKQGTTLLITLKSVL